MRHALLNSIFAAFGLLHLAAQANNPRPADLRKFHLSAPVVGYNSEGELILTGELSATTVETAQKFFDQYRNIKVVYIDSPGGDAASAREIANMIRRHKLDLVVDGVCLSTCATYIYPAAVKTTVLAGSSVGKH
jgi:ClpP class serine protease